MSVRPGQLRLWLAQSRTREHWLLCGGDRRVSFWLSDVMGQSQDRTGRKPWGCVSSYRNTWGLHFLLHASSTGALQSQPGQQLTALWTHLRVVLLR